MELLARGCGSEAGLGDLIAVDVGGATTDVYSMADGMPLAADTVYKGLPEPYAKRTVEGDIGMRYTIHGIVDAAGLATRRRSLPAMDETRAAELVDYLGNHTGRRARARAQSSNGWTTRWARMASGDRRGAPCGLHGGNLHAYGH